MTALAPFFHTAPAMSTPVVAESAPIDRVGAVSITLEGRPDGTAGKDSTAVEIPLDAEIKHKKDNVLETDEGEGEGIPFEGLAADQGIESVAGRAAVVEGDGGSLSSCVAPAGSSREAVGQLSVVKVGCSGLVMLRSKAGASQVTWQ